jgi:hypothetical protein
MICWKPVHRTLSHLPLKSVRPDFLSGLLGLKMRTWILEW